MAPQKICSQAEVARLANMSQPRIIKLVRKGYVVPDFTDGKRLLFTIQNAQAIKEEFGR